MFSSGYRKHRCAGSLLTLPVLRGEGGPQDGDMLYLYNEGAIVDSMKIQQESWFPSQEPEYPSLGFYPVCPNMTCSQMMVF